MYFLIFFLFAGGGTLYAQQFPSLEAAPAAYEHARRSAPVNAHWRDLAAAALWASSVNTGPGAEEKAAAYLAAIDEAARELATADIPRNINERGEYVLNFIHRRFLKSYSGRQTRLDEIFVSGKYNCVSSAVLYMALGLSVGLDIEGVITKDHAFASVNTGAERIDVETTNRYGFDPGSRKDFHDAFGKATGFAYTPAHHYRDRAAINRAEMVSLILSNRIAALEENNRFAEAVPLAINRAVFLSVNSHTENSEQHKAEFFENPWQDMMHRLFNLGTYFVKTGKEDDAIAWAAYAGERFPDPLNWQRLITTASHNKLVKLIRAKKIPDAYIFLAAARPKLNHENYLELETMLLDAAAADKINTIRGPGDAANALDFLARLGERLPPGRRTEMRTAAVLAEAERLRKAGNVIEGVQWLTDAIETYGSDTKLETALRALRQNRIGELHNEFARLYNRKQYQQAKNSIQQSLREFPNERQLRNDLNMVEKALQ